MLTLDEIFKKNECEKGSFFHGYDEIYEPIFSTFRTKKFSLLEIGVCRGHSMKVWEEYFPNALIHGIDILDRKKFDTARVKTHKLNQKNEAGLAKLGSEFGPFDVIIDDGEHSSKAILASFNTLLKFVSPGGYYIIEDIHCVKQHGSPEPNEALDFFTKLVQDITLKGVIGNQRGFRKAMWWTKKTDLRKGKGFVPSFLQANIRSIQFMSGLIIVRKFSNVV